MECPEEEQAASAEVAPRFSLMPIKELPNAVGRKVSRLRGRWHRDLGYWNDPAPILLVWLHFRLPAYG